MKSSREFLNNHGIGKGTNLSFDSVADLIDAYHTEYKLEFGSLPYIGTEELMAEKKKFLDPWTPLGLDVRYRNKFEDELNLLLSHQYDSVFNLFVGDDEPGLEDNDDDDSNLPN